MATKGRILVILNFLCYLFFFFISPSYTDTDTILQGQQLRDWDRLNSANNVFRLQFFCPILSNSNNQYLGIFYNIPPHAQVLDGDLNAVWVANRNSPIPDTSGNLVIDSSDGKLKIIFSGGNQIVLSSVAATTSNASVTLLDSGNLVFKEQNPDGSVKQVLWQSFDYPTDTLLPGMKLGIDFKTGHKWSLTSWISAEVPASGSFTFGGDPNGTNQLITWWQGDVYWTSGLWLWPDGRFELVPRLSYYDYYNFSYVSNENEKYLIYSVNGNQTFPRYTLSPNGEVKERQLVTSFGACSLPDDIFYNVGCVKEVLPECRKAKYGLEERQGYVYSDGFKFDQTYNLSIFDCQAKCERNCTCVAFASINDNNETGCEIWGQPIMSSF